MIIALAVSTVVSNVICVYLIFRLREVEENQQEEDKYLRKCVFETSDIYSDYINAILDHMGFTAERKFSRPSKILLVPKLPTGL